MMAGCKSKTGASSQPCPILAFPAPALAFAISLLLLCNAAYPQSAAFRDEQGTSFENRLEQDWWALGIAAIFICLLATTLVYMTGYFLQSEQLKHYAKSELLQASASSLMILFAVALVYGLSNSSALGLMGDILGEGSHIACAASGNGKFLIWGEGSKFGTGPIGAFKCKVQEKITALDASYDKVFQANMGRERLSSMCLFILGAPAYCWDWDLSLHKDVERNHLVATKIVSLLVPLHAQYSLAQYIQNNMLTVFLPAGLVLRIFPLTRGVGGLFIAIAVGFFFVWPTFVVLTDPTFVKVEGTGQADMLAGKCFTGFKGITTLLSAEGTASSAATSALASSEGAALVYEVTIGAVFYPFISFVLTLIFIRAATPILGGDMGELMKMVSRLV
jgi:hypothetical protein